jgi:molecular chaperone GrpE
LEALRAQVVEQQNNYLRAVADLQNYRRKRDQDEAREHERLTRQIISRFLPVADDFQRALASVPVEEGQQSWLDGFRLINRNLWSVLESYGVEPMEALGQPFDPSRHDAAMADNSAGPADTVVDVFSPGYLIRGDVLRPATVKVGAPGLLRQA